MNRLPLHRPFSARLAAALLASLLAAPAAARPLPSAGARALALGGAYVAEDEDVNVLFFNPAGLTGLTGRQLSANYGRFDPGAFAATTELHGAFGMPTNFQGRPIGAAGGFLSQSIAPGVHRVDLYGGFGADVPTRGIVPWPVHGGGVLKIREQGGGDKDVDVGKTQFGFGLDGGAQMKFNEDATVGIVLRDLFTSGLNPPGPQIRVGGKYRVQGRVVLMGDLEARRNVTALHAGAEWLFYRDLLKLRLGNGFRVSRGDSHIDHVAFGAGFNYSPAQIDIAYVIPVRTFNDPSQQFRITVLYKFNAPRFSELYYDRALDMADDVDRRVGQLEEREAQLKASVQDLEQARRLAEEDMARTTVRRTESERELQDELVKARARAQQAEERAQGLEEKVQAAEEKIRRAERISRPPPEPKEPAIRKHVVAAGDSLRSLAKKYYNDAERWQTIYNANKDKVDRGRLVPGTELVIP